jgi:hypothetical protein
MNPHLSEKFDQLLQVSLEDVKEIKLLSQERKLMLDALVGYYELHHTHGARIKSHEILSEVLG